MSVLFGDIYEAIRAERIKKGACEKDILNMVQEKIGGCMSVDHVLKTIKTLKKLVDEGVLIKKGKRYIINTEKDHENCGKEEDNEGQNTQNKKPGEENECDDNDNDNDDDDDEEEDEGDEEDQCCNGGGDENKDDDDDDDNDDDDDDEDNDDDDDDDEDNDDDDDESDNDNDDEGDECDNQGANAAKKLSLEKTNTPKQNMKEKSGSFMCKSPNKIILNANQPKSPETPAEQEAKRNERKQMSSESMASAKRNESRDKNPAEKNIIRTSTEKKSRGGENIAFCARDFIDSQNRPRTRSKIEEKFATLGDLMQTNMNAIENGEMREILKERERKFQTKQNKTSRSKLSRNKTSRRKKSRSRCHSRFPSKKCQASAFSNLKGDCFENLRGLSSQYPEEPMDADVDVNLEKDKYVKTEHKVRSSCEILPSTASRADIESNDGQKEKSPSLSERKICTAKNALPEMMATIEADEIQKAPRRENEQKIKRKKEFSDDENNDDNEKTSLSSICEKPVKHPRIEKA